ncbi:ATP-binding protein [Actinomadura hibisca]|uniref:ATP-binding protein n=1 Tax=Actinomadura hibisca TaxID=68565 RepID=UPI0008319341|nr:ATP-binding protein [Actinomadura hibisca]
MIKVEKAPAAPAEVASLVIAARAESIKKARDFVTAVLTRAGLDASSVHLAATIATELVTNAYKHGSQPGDPIAVRAYLADAGPVLEVWDTSDAPPVAQPFDVERLSGRGLLLVSEMARDWGTTPLAPSGKAVWALLRESYP